MKKLENIIIEEDDMLTVQQLINSIGTDAMNRAPVVILNGVVVKNRYGRTYGVIEE